MERAFKIHYRKNTVKGAAGTRGADKASVEALIYFRVALSIVVEIYFRVAKDTKRAAHKQPFCIHISMHGILRFFQSFLIFLENDLLHIISCL